MNKKKVIAPIDESTMGNTPERLDKAAGVFPSAPGLSNTRCVAYNSSALKAKLNVCFDWFKVSFNKKFSPSDPWWEGLLLALKVNPNEYDVDRGGSGAKESYWFDEAVAFYTGGERTKSNGQETTWMDLSGQACRDFEERGGDWKELVGAVLPMVERGNRIDVAIDDFTGIISIADLLQKIWSHSYTTKLRRLIVQGEVDEDGSGETDKPMMTFSKNGGFTATFGGKSTKQLCIYNKKAERTSKEYVVVPDTWIRYEARFFHEAAFSVLQELYSALCKESMPQVVAGLVGGLVEFKESACDSVANNRNSHKIPIWEKWSQLLQGVSAITIQNQARIELSLAKKHEWLKTASGRTMGMVFLAEPSEFDNVVGFIVASWLQRLNKRSVASVNTLRRRYNKEPISFDDAVSQLTARFAKFQELSPYLQSLFKTFDNDTGEILDPDELKERKK